VQSVPGSLSSVLLQEPLQQQFSSSNSCHATAASASASESSVHGASADAGAAGSSTAAADRRPAEAPAGACIVLLFTWFKAPSSLPTS
jgi:hypothetical protein